MSLTVGTIVSQVRSAIDEVMQNDSDFLRESNDELNLTDIIISKIGFALQHVVENAPVEKLDSDAFETLSSEEASGFSVDGTSLVGKLKIPTDLLRIIDARLSSWTRFPIPVTDMSQVALMQQDEYARGSYDRPVNILTYEGTDRYLMMYCAKTASDTLNFTFIRKPKADEYSADNPNKEVKVPSLLEASLIYQIAGLTMVAFKEEVAASLFAIAQRYLDPEQQRNTDE